MKRCSLFCAGPWPFIFLPLILLLPLLAFKWHAIEDDVARNAQAKLAAAGANWATIETVNRGRNVLITGTPPNDAAIEVAKDAAASAYGVNAVDVSSDVKPPTSAPELNTTITGDLVTLGGVLASQAEVDAVISKATDAFGEGNVTNKLSISRNTATLPALNGFFQNLTGRSVAEKPLTATLNGGSLTLNGIINSDESNSELVMQMTQNLGLDVNSSLDKGYDCQNLVNDLLETSEINFASAKAIIKEDSFDLLNRIKLTAMKCPDARFEVSGHTDSSGDLLFNMRLSEQRAISVVEHLVGFGLDASQFSAAGYGPNKPLAENTTLTGRAQNRRIEFNLKN